MGWLLLSLRRLRDARQASIAIVLLVLVTATVFAIAPRLLDRLANDVLRSDVGGAPPDQRNVQLIQDTLIGSGATPMQIVDDTGARFQSNFPGELARLVTGREALVDTGRWKSASRPLDEATVRVRIQPDAQPRLRLVDGRFPTGASLSVPNTIDPANPDIPASIPEFEVAMPVPSAQVLGMTVGDELTIRTDTTDHLNGPVTHYLAIKLVGMFAEVDPNDPIWFNDTSLEHFAVRSPSPLVQIQDATALASPDAYVALATSTAQAFTSLRYTWRYTIDPARLDARRADALLADLRRMESVFPAVSGRTAGTEQTTLQTALLRIVGDFIDRWRSVVAVLAAVSTGPALISLAGLGFVAALAGARRRASFALARARGGSVGQLVGSATVEAALLIVPPALGGVAIAVAALPSDDLGPSLMAGAAVALIAILVVVASAWPRVEDVARGRRALPTPRGRAVRRLVAEALIVGLAVVGVVLLRQRGVQAASAAGVLAAPDPLIAAVPALIALAAGIAAVRVFPLPMRLAAFVASARRDIVPFLAFRRLGQGGAARVLLVLLAAVALGVFTAAALLHVDEAAEAIAWHDVGAPYRIVGPTMSTLDPAKLPNVEVAARVTERPATIDPRGSPVTVIATDPSAYRGVVSGTPIDPGLGLEFDAPTADPIPAVVSPAFAAGNAIAEGDSFVLNLNSARRTFVATAIAQPIPTVSGTDTAVVVSLAQLSAAVPNLGLTPIELLVRAPDNAEAGIRDVVSRTAIGSRVESRAGESAAVRSSPVVGAVRLGATVAMIVAALYAALALAAAMALTAASRAVEVAGLRTLGLTRRQAVGLVLAEHGPTLVFALLVGLPTGFIAFAILRPGLGLARIVGSSIDIPIRVDALQLAAAAGIVALVVTGATLVGAVLQANVVAAMAIRREAE